MMSPTLCPKSLVLVLVIITVFTVSLTENLQLADGLSASSTKLVYELGVGEMQLLTWKVINDDNEPLEIEMYATGEGSELFVFEEDIIIDPHEIREIEIFVVVPEDHPDNVEYHPQVFAKKVKEHTKDAEGAKININIQMVTKPIIKIGDNPIYQNTPIEEPTGEEKEEIEPKEVAPEKEIVEDIPGESLADKLARIQAANLGNQPDVKIDDTWEESFEEEAVPDPVMDAEPIATQEEKVECDFFAWFLSLFGIGKC